jgi:hypothetical protein
VWIELTREKPEPWDPRRPVKTPAPRFRVRSMWTPEQKALRAEANRIYRGKVEHIRWQRVRTDPKNKSKLWTLKRKSLQLKSLKTSFDNSSPSLEGLIRLRSFSVSTASRNRAKHLLKRRPPSPKL